VAPLVAPFIPLTLNDARPAFDLACPIDRANSVCMCVWGHAIVCNRHRLTVMPRQGRIPNTAPFFSRYGVTNENKSRSDALGDAVGRVRFPSRSEDEVQSDSCGCRAP
jgi:hypothetical protein